MKILAIVAARGGSKGVKGKNKRGLAGKPLIAHTISQAIQWGKFEKLVITTDSLEIAEIAKEYGGDVPFMRPAELGKDHVGKLDVLRHALRESEKYYSLTFDALLDLDVTAPIRTVEDIDNIVNLFKKKKPDCIFSVTKAHKNPYFNMVERNQKGEIFLCKQSAGDVLCRQKAPQVYSMNASLYVYAREFLLNEENKLPYSGKSEIYEMSEFAAVDIDSELDFKFIEFLVKEKVVQL